MMNNELLPFAHDSDPLKSMKYQKNEYTVTKKSEYFSLLTDSEAKAHFMHQCKEVYFGENNSSYR